MNGTNSTSDDVSMMDIMKCLSFIRYDYNMWFLNIVDGLDPLDLSYSTWLFFLDMFMWLMGVHTIYLYHQNGSPNNSYVIDISTDLCNGDAKLLCSKCPGFYMCSFCHISNVHKDHERFLVNRW